MQIDKVRGCDQCSGCPSHSQRACSQASGDGADVSDVSSRDRMGFPFVSIGAACDGLFPTTCPSQPEMAFQFAQAHMEAGEYRETITW